MIAEARSMFPEEKFGTLELEGEVNPVTEEEDTSDAPTIVIPERQFRKEEREEREDWFLPF
jgi:hypothetical protein